MALDSHTGRPWSSITGTSPLGFISRYSGVCVPPKAPPTSIDSYGRPISSAHHSTLRTLLELRRPQIFSIPVPVVAVARPARYARSRFLSAGAAQRGDAVRPRLLPSRGARLPHL